MACIWSPKVYSRPYTDRRARKSTAQNPYNTYPPILLVPVCGIFLTRLSRWIQPNPTGTWHPAHHPLHLPRQSSMALHAFTTLSFQTPKHWPNSRRANIAKRKLVLSVFALRSGTCHIRRRAGDVARGAVVYATPCLGSKLPIIGASVFRVGSLGEIVEGSVEESCVRGGRRTKSAAGIKFGFKSRVGREIFMS